MRAFQAVPLLLLVFVASCSGVQKAEDASKPPPDTTVVVENRKTVDLNLYVLNGARRSRLGTVPGMSSRSFVIPPHLIGDADRIRFGVEIIGTFGSDGVGSERRFLSEEELPVTAGEELSLVIH
ncbi:hypothetical protein ACLESD_18815 [Pyxidicoccus sp. 3LFB2]